MNTRPGQGTFELKDPRLLVPGEPDRSLIPFRMGKIGLGRMPHIASNVVDTEAVELIREWIKEMPRLIGEVGAAVVSSKFRNSWAGCRAFRGVKCSICIRHEKPGATTSVSSPA